MNIGDNNARFQVNIFDETIGKPIADAPVLITSSTSDFTFQEELVSNSSGQTAVVNLSSPPIEFSLEKSVAEEKPYSEYDLTVNITGYESVSVKGVQIFPDALAIQDIFLKPSNTSTKNNEIINIDEHILWGSFPTKTPEKDIKPLPSPTNFALLDEPIIPEFIVVHNGVPDDKNAKNYYVPFKDYIKNVASCEIYANWPAETLKANILAIISFTLNRVFTEWYRSRGYDFTITNSTAFDQAFQYGRNYFAEISRTVDEIFTMYITKSGIRQPLMTQYCDGKTVSCPNWLSQWGSKDLGDKGYSAVNILKQFYGQDIYLMEATKVSGIPSSYPGTIFQVGSSGKDVKTIQEQLNEISKNFPLIQKVVVDSVYGQGTRASVSKFQEIFHIPSSGMVDYSTWYELSRVFVAVTKIAET